MTLPIGYLVEQPTELQRPKIDIYDGKFISLAPVNPEQDVDELFECSHGKMKFEQLWAYMPYGPFADKADMMGYLNNCAGSTDPIFLTVTDKVSGKKRGVVSFLNIVPDHLRLELGHIWYSPLVQRSKLNTEVIYLMLCESFDRLHYRRVEWKCDALNSRSRAAAQRLGFSFEGIFYKHIINKGRNRDTAWLAMTDDDWVKVKPNMEKFLYSDEQGFSMRAANKPHLRTLDTGEASQQDA